ncbi:ABC transporter ATP-binding protein [Natronorubrum sp. A-ect3]|uniref:ABC transporter ATP-binding protein n=1 Tax=Natronorubrum sp. A-ect3 TaxID=3242698 RepID=UPI00359D36A3
MNTIEVENVTKEFGSLTAVEDANFQIKDGEFVSILGPSGSGKSTILRMVAGFETPTTGSITIEGNEVVGVPPFERDSNMVFQNLALFPHLTVAENIEYGLKQNNVDKETRQKRVSEMLETVRLEGYGDRQPDELSGGEQQRVALARAIVNEPAVVLFDEPLASLDRKLRQHMQFELQRIQSETGITFLYVTHDQDIALSISDRMIVLNDGIIQQVGTVEELYNTPTSQFVADFLGDLNAIPSTITNLSDEHVTLDTSEGLIEIELDAGGRDENLIHSDSLTEGEPVNLCLRPHEISLQTEPPDNGQFSVTGTVKSRMFRGNEIAYIIETRWDEFLVIEDAANEQFTNGTPIHLTWSRAGTYLFAPTNDTKTNVNPV